MRNIKINFICMGVSATITVSIFITDVLTDMFTGDKTLALLKIVAATCISYFIPDIIRFCKRFIDKSKAGKELGVLKRMFVICGSVKPVDFGKLMKLLISKADYFKPDLEVIYESHQKSNTDTGKFYSELRDSAKNIDTKLFYEKLDMAANYDFDLAVKNIRDDFIREKRENYRKVKKKVEIINMIGIAGLFAAIAVIMLYLLAPWIEMLELNNI